jgi:hypothetical protein
VDSALRWIDAGSDFLFSGTLSRNNGTPNSNTDTSAFSAKPLDWHADIRMDLVCCDMVAGGRGTILPCDTADHPILFRARAILDFVCNHNGRTCISRCGLQDHEKSFCRLISYAGTGRRAGVGHLIGSGVALARISAIP